MPIKPGKNFLKDSTVNITSDSLLTKHELSEHDDDKPSKKKIKRILKKNKRPEASPLVLYKSAFREKSKYAKFFASPTLPTNPKPPILKEKTNKDLSIVNVQKPVKSKKVKKAKDFKNIKRIRLKNFQTNG